MISFTIIVELFLFGRFISRRTVGRIRNGLFLLYVRRAVPLFRNHQVYWSNIDNLRRYLKMKWNYWFKLSTFSCIGCGLVQAHYTFSNISQKSYTTVKYFIKMLSSTSDCIIFLFLGMVLVNDVHEWHTGFVFWTLFLCLAVRFLGIVLS